jgi:hypothetical protein
METEERRERRVNREEEVGGGGDRVREEAGVWKSG